MRVVLVAVMALALAPSLAHASDVFDLRYTGHTSETVSGHIGKSKAWTNTLHIDLPHKL